MAYRQNDPQRRNDVVRFDLMEHIGVLSQKENGWTREVNIVSWNNGAAKVDIREWDPDHKRMTKGVTLFEEEAETLTKVLARRYGLRIMDRQPAHREFFTEEAGASADEAAEEAAVLDDDSEEAPAAPAAEPHITPAAAAPAMT